MSQPADSNKKREQKLDDKKKAQEKMPAKISPPPK
jgi:hypothetical protein